ncbi:MAG: Ig domain-containing protein, partial [Clostridia bacterium]|nr:Ig domain-containing protein [Clostridia bacterium]
YIKVSSNGDLGRRVETVEYNIHGQVIRDRVEDFVVKKGVNIFANLPSPYDNLIDVTKGYYDITKKQLKVADIKKQIMEMDISDSEKEERLEALQKMNENATTIKLLSMLSTEVCLITTLVCPPAGIILDFATGIFWSYLNANMDILFNDLTTNLLNVLFRFAVDPSGFIYEAITGNRLSNVKATAFFKTTETEEATLWDATEYEQMNPLYTDANGCYAWDVPEGLWQVKFEKEGYETTYSEWLPVPPPQLEVNIGMNSLSAPEVEYVNVYNDGVEIRFTQYMNIDSINSTNIVITSNGTTISGDFEAIDSGFNYEETEEYAKTFYFTPTKDINGTANVKINNVENYCSAKILNEYNQSHNVTLRIDSMSVEENETAEYKANKNIVVQAYPVEAAAGKIVNVVLSNAYIAEAESTTLTFDENGRATLKLSTLLPGEVDITFEIAETSISAKTKLFVSAVEHISVTGVSINYSSITLTNGETKQLVATVTPEDATNKALLWNSNNENVVKVDENGLITAMSEGVAVVSVTTSDGTYQATCEVEVVASGHNYTTVITVPTCTENGYTTYTCSICGDSYVSDEVSATGHNYDNGNCSVCGDFDPNYTPDDPEYNYTFSIQTPSTTTIRHKDGIKLHANVEGNAPAGSYVEWTASNGKFKTEETNNGNSLKIVSDKNGYTTFTATLYSADGEVLATDSIEMKSKAGFFDKFGSFFRSLFGTTKIYEN